MILYCSVCHRPVPPGLNQCQHCKSGFGAQLACCTCNRLVARGAATCFECDREISMQARQRSGPGPEPESVDVSLVTLPAAPPALPGLPSHVKAITISETYSAGRFGVQSQVTIPQVDVETMNLMGQLVVVLHTVAEKMNQLAHSESLRRLIKNCRVLAADVQEEIEIRRGSS